MSQHIGMIKNIKIDNLIKYRKACLFGIIVVVLALIFISANIMTENKAKKEIEREYIVVGYYDSFLYLDKLAIAAKVMDGNSAVIVVRYYPYRNKYGCIEKRFEMQGEIGFLRSKNGMPAFYCKREYYYRTSAGKEYYVYDFYKNNEYEYLIPEYETLEYDTNLYDGDRIDDYLICTMPYKVFIGKDLIKSKPTILMRLYNNDYYVIDYLRNDNVNGYSEIIFESGKRVDKPNVEIKPGSIMILYNDMNYIKNDFFNENIDLNMFDAFYRLNYNFMVPTYKIGYTWDINTFYIEEAALKNQKIVKHITTGKYKIILYEKGLCIKDLKTGKAYPVYSLPDSKKEIDMEVSGDTIDIYAKDINENKKIKTAEYDMKTKKIEIIFVKKRGDIDRIIGVLHEDGKGPCAPRSL